MGQQPSTLSDSHLTDRLAGSTATPPLTVSYNDSTVLPLKNRSSCSAGRGRDSQ